MRQYKVMQLVYLQFGCPADLKQFRDLLSVKKIFIVLNRNILLSQFSRKEIELARHKFYAEIIQSQVL